MHGQTWEVVKVREIKLDAEYRPTAAAVLRSPDRGLLVAGLRMIDLSPSTSSPPVSPRACQILTMLVEGMRLKEIYGNLGIAPSTVTTTLATARERVGANSNMHLLALGIQCGWLRPL